MQTFIPTNRYKKQSNIESCFGKKYLCFCSLDLTVTIVFSIISTAIYHKNSIKYVIWNSFEKLWAFLDFEKIIETK